MLGDNRVPSSLSTVRFKSFLAGSVLGIIIAFSVVIGFLVFELQQQKLKQQLAALLEQLTAQQEQLSTFRVQLTEQQHQKQQLEKQLGALHEQWTAQQEQLKAPAIIEKQQELVRVFYGTNRRASVNAGDLTFGSERDNKLNLGSVHVTIPTKVHRVGSVERPWSLTLFNVRYGYGEDPSKHFTVQHIESMNHAVFIEKIKENIELSQNYKRQAFIFIHGYNTDFNSAAYRAAQIAYDIQFDGIPILYSWPSRGGIGDYEYDQNSARQARDTLKDFIELIKKESNADIVHIIAHSMGNDPLIEVLGQISSSNDKNVVFNEIILAAPDIDVDVFQHLIQKLRGVTQGITMYASANDFALKISKFYAGGVPRAGDVPADGPVIIPGIDTIDVTSVGTSVFSLNHSEYVESRDLLDDLGRLLKFSVRPPSDRIPTLRRVEKENGVYWIFPP